MSSNVHLLASLRNTMMDEVNTVIGAGGFLRIYAGAQPANADAPLSGGNVQLAELALSATPFSAAVDGRIEANAIADDPSADATGTAVWASYCKSDGTRVVDVSVATGGADINLNTTSIIVGARTSVVSASLTIAA